MKLSRWEGQHCNRSGSQHKYYR